MQSHSNRLDFFLFLLLLRRAELVYSPQALFLMISSVLQCRVCDGLFILLHFLPCHMLFSSYLSWLELNVPNVLVPNLVPPLRLWTASITVTPYTVYCTQYTVYRYCISTYSQLCNDVDNNTFFIILPHYTTNKNLQRNQHIQAVSWLVVVSLLSASRQMKEHRRIEISAL